LIEVCEQIAFHYDRGESAEQAIPYLLRAGLKARGNSANEAAIAHLQRGLELLEAQPEGTDRDRRELELLLALGVPLVLTRGHASPEVESNYARAHALCAQGCDPADHFQAVLGLRRAHFVACELRAARALGEELLEIAGKIDDRSYLARAHMMQGELLNSIGAFDASLEHCIKGLAATSDDRQQRAARFRYGNDTQVGCGIYAAWAQWYLGYPDQAAASVRAMLALAESLSHPFTLTFALGHAAEFYQHVQDTHETLAHSLRLIQLAAEHAFVLLEARGTVAYGWTLVARGGTEEGLLAIKKGVSALQRMGTEWGLAYSLMLKADALRRAGRAEQGLHTVERALALESTSIVRRWQADMHRLRGELIVTSGGHEREAEACFRRALEIARKQDARSWELRAATSLGRLLHRQGRIDEARALVRGICGWFSEGFDTADLREAKALLEQWAG
jgi:adenylate cyclase